MAQPLFTEVSLASLMTLAPLRAFERCVDHLAAAVTVNVLKGGHPLSEKRRSINIIGDKRSIHW